MLGSFFRPIAHEIFYLLIFRTLFIFRAELSIKLVNQISSNAALAGVCCRYRSDLSSLDDLFAVATALKHPNLLRWQLARDQIPR